MIIQKAHQRAATIILAIILATGCSISEPATTPTAEPTILTPATRSSAAEHPLPQGITPTVATIPFPKITPRTTIGALPTTVPAHTATRSLPTTRPRRTGHQLNEEPSDQPGQPYHDKQTLAAIESLPSEQRECLDPEVESARTESDFRSVASTHHAQVLEKASRCLDDKTITRLMALPNMIAEAGLDEAQQSCMEASNTGRMIRKALSTHGAYHTFTDAAFFAAAGMILNAQVCVSPDELVFPSLPEGSLNQIACLLQNAEQAERLIDAVINDQQTALADVQERAQTCIPGYTPSQVGLLKKTYGAAAWTSRRGRQVQHNRQTR